MNYIIYNANNGKVSFYDGTASTTANESNAKRFQRIGDAMQVAGNLNQCHTANESTRLWQIKSI